MFNGSARKRIELYGWPSCLNELEDVDGKAFAKGFSFRIIKSLEHLTIPLIVGQE